MKKNEYIMIIGIALCLLLAGSVVGVWIADQAQTLPTELIGNVFVDLNADGFPDYLYRGEAIFNPGVPLP